jgi:hypothetical protein
MPPLRMCCRPIRTTSPRRWTVLRSNSSESLGRVPNGCFARKASICREVLRGYTVKPLDVHESTPPVAALTDAAVQSQVVDLAVEIFPREQQTPEALGALVESDAENWWPVIKEFGIKAE